MLTLMQAYSNQVIDLNNMHGEFKNTIYMVILHSG